MSGCGYSKSGSHIFALVSTFGIRQDRARAECRGPDQFRESVPPQFQIPSVSRNPLCRLCTAYLLEQVPVDVIDLVIKHASVGISARTHRISFGDSECSG